jgi:hypothetical protein
VVAVVRNSEHIDELTVQGRYGRTCHGVPKTLTAAVVGTAVSQTGGPRGIGPEIPGGGVSSF